MAKGSWDSVKCGRETPRSRWHKTIGWRPDLPSCSLRKSAGRHEGLVVLFLDVVLLNLILAAELLAIDLEVALQGATLAQQ